MKKRIWIMRELKKNWRYVHSFRKEDNVLFLSEERVAFGEATIVYIAFVLIHLSFQTEWCILLQADNHLYDIIPKSFFNSERILSSYQSLGLSLSQSLSLCLSVSLSLSLYIYIYIYIPPYSLQYVPNNMSLSQSLSVCLSVCLSLSLYIYIYIYIPPYSLQYVPNKTLKISER